MDEESLVLDHQCIKNEIALLQSRLIVLLIFDHFLVSNPPFYDEKRSEIVEPYNSFLHSHLPLFDVEQFIKEIVSIWTPAKSGTYYAASSILPNQSGA